MASALTLCAGTLADAMMDAAQRRSATTTSGDASDARASSAARPKGLRSGRLPAAGGGGGASKSSGVQRGSHSSASTRSGCAASTAQTSALRFALPPLSAGATRPAATSKAATAA